MDNQAVHRICKSRLIAISCVAVWARTNGTDSPAAFTQPILSVELIAVDANLRVGHGGIQPSFRDGIHIGFIRRSPIPELN